MQNQSIRIDPETDIRIECAEFDFSTRIKNGKICINRRDPDKKKMISLISDAMKARLFVAGWQLSKDLEGVRRTLKGSSEFTYYTYKEIKYVKIAIAYHGNKPIAILYEDGSQKYVLLQVFCKNTYRRNSITSFMIKNLFDSNRNYLIGKGNDASVPFWNKIQETRPNNYYKRWAF
jgi:hypothetical protein